MDHFGGFEITRIAHRGRDATLLPPSAAMAFKQ